MKKKNGWTTKFKHLVVGMLALIVVFAGGMTGLASFLYSNVDYESETESDTLAGKDGYVDIDFRYAFYSDLDTTDLSSADSTKSDVTNQYGETTYEIGFADGTHITISDKASYYALNTFLVSHTSLSAELTGTTDGTTYTAVDKTITGDAVKGYEGTMYTIIVYTTIHANEDFTTLGSTEYTGEYVMYSQSYSCGYKTKQSSDTVRKQLSVPSGYSLTDTYVSGLFSSGVEGYAFYGLVDAVESNETYVPSESLSLSYSYGDSITESKHFYAIFTKSTASEESTITKAVNNTSSGSTTNIYIGANGEGCNVSTDPTYVSSINNVALGTSDNATTVAEGATVNFCLNSSATQAYATYNKDPYDADTNPTGYYLKVKPQEENRQYTVSLQNDLYVNGTLVIGGTYGSGTCSGTEGNINSYYVVLDLNGHDIHVSSTGSVICYGMIIDSSLVPGTIHLKGGNITTLLVMLDYKDFYATFACAMTYVCPFQLYFLPYLRCRVEFTYDSTNGWGEIDSFCRVHAATKLTVIAWTVDGLATDLTLNLIGPKSETTSSSSSSKAFIFELEKPEEGKEDKASVVFEYNTLDGVLADTDATEEDLNNINDYSLFVRNGLTFNNVEFTMGNVDITFNLNRFGSITIGYANDFSFPISPFFDIALNGSTFTLDSQLQFEAGSTFTADSDSKIILTTATYKNGPYSGGVRFGGISSLDRGINYYDKKTGNFVEGNSLNGLTMDGNLVTGFDSTSLSITKKVNVKETFTTTVDDIWGNETLWKYLGGASVTIRGQLLLDASKGATDASIKSSGRCYKLAGEINFNEDNVGLITAKMGTLLYGDVVAGTYDNDLLSMASSEDLSLIKALDPFSAVAYGAWALCAQGKSYSDALYMQTYGYDFIPGQYPGEVGSTDYDGYYTSSAYFVVFMVYYTELNERGFARPLVSNGKAYVVDTIADTSTSNYGVPTISYEGTYDFDTGIFTSSVKNTLTSLSSSTESNTYYFDVYDSDKKCDSNGYDSSFEKQTPTDAVSSGSSGSYTFYMPDYGLAITECSVSAEKDGIGPYITSDASGASSKYRYFAGIYVKDSSYISYETYVLQNAATLMGYSGSTATDIQNNVIDPLLNSVYSDLTKEMNYLGSTYAVSYLGKLFTLANCSSIALYYDSSCNAYKYNEQYTNANFAIQLNFANLMSLMS